MQHGLTAFIVLHLITHRCKSGAKGPVHPSGQILKGWHPWLLEDAGLMVSASGVNASYVKHLLPLSEEHKVFTNPNKLVTT